MAWRAKSEFAFRTVCVFSLKNVHALPHAGPLPPGRGRSFRAPPTTSPSGDWSRRGRREFPAHEPLVRSSGFSRSGPPEGGTPSPLPVGSRLPTHVQCLEVLAAHKPQKNIEHRTSNTERPMRRTIRCWMFDGSASPGFRGALRAHSPGRSLLGERARVRASQFSNCIVTAKGQGENAPNSERALRP